MSSKFYDGIVRRFSGFVKWYFRLEVSGAENEPPEGPLLICSNHLSMADVALMGATLKRQVRFLAKAELFRVPVLGWFVRNMNAVPLKRGQSDVAALKAVIKIIEEGGAACVYPQGHRRPGVDPASTEIQHGAGMIVWRAKCTVLPVAFQAKGWRIRPFRKTRLIIGKPIGYGDFAMTAGRPDEYKRVTERIFGAVTELFEK